MRLLSNTARTRRSVPAQRGGRPDLVLQHAKWRVTPHGIAIVCGWFGLTKEESVRTRRFAPTEGGDGAFNGRDLPLPAVKTTIRAQ